MTHLVRRLRRGTRGQSVVEFALLIPMIMVFVVAVIDFGKLFYTYQVITNAAREGARYAALADAKITDGVVQQAIRTSLEPIADPGAISFVAKPAAGTCPPLTLKPGGFVLVYGCGWSGTPAVDPSAVVEIRMEYKTVLLGRFLDLTTGQQTFPLTTRMVMRNE
ncbi:MAG: TadE/TadG family type IV pilus assembly protein [Longimicrobiaceae bacterium]